MSRPAAAALATALWGASAVARAGDVDVTADRVEVRDGTATGEGSVVATVGDQRVKGARFSLVLETGALVVEDGVWERPEGALAFERAEVALGEGVGVALGARLEGADGRLRAEGDVLRWEGEGQLSGEHVRLTTCGCERPPWEVEARRVVVRLDDVATFSGGWVRVCGARVLPVPAGAVALTDENAIRNLIKRHQ